jgi:hypothetical protein
MLLGVAAGADQFVAVGVGVGGTVLTSPDGSQWTRRATGAPNLHQELWAVTYGGGAFVAVGFQNPGGAVAAVSSNGIDWESFNLPIQTTPRNIAYGNGRYVAAGAPVSMSSSNGRDWTPINSLPAQGIAYGEGQFIATLTTSGFKSSNGVDWAQFPLPVLGSGIQNYYTARYANGTFLSGGFCDDCPNTNRPGLLATSSSGGRWAARHVATTNVGAIRDIIFVDGRYYLADQDGRIWKSGRTAPATAPVLSQVACSGGETRFSFSTLSGFYYAVEWTDRLTSPDWKPLLGPLFATSDRFHVTDRRDQPKPLYRIRTE